MNKTVDIRRFYEEDALALEDVIRKTWKYDAFCSSETAARLAHVYLYSCLANQTFTAVAIVDGKPCGIHIQKHRCPFFPEAAKPSCYCASAYNKRRQRNLFLLREDSEC